MEVLAKKTVEAASPAVLSSFHVQAVPLKFAPQPGKTFFDSTTKELVTMSETELVRYNKSDPGGVRIPIQVCLGFAFFGFFFIYFFFFFLPKRTGTSPSKIASSRPCTSTFASSAPTWTLNSRLSRRCVQKTTTPACCWWLLLRCERSSSKCVGLVTVAFWASTGRFAAIWLSSQRWRWSCTK